MCENFTSCVIVTVANVITENRVDAVSVRLNRLINVDGDTVLPRAVDARYIGTKMFVKEPLSILVFYRILHLIIHC